MSSRKVVLLVAVALITTCAAHPTVTTVKSLVTPTVPGPVLPLEGHAETISASEDDDFPIATAGEQGPRMRSLRVQCNVTNRYARTAVLSRYANPSDTARLATFSVVLPDSAFITGFVMVVGGLPYEAYVAERAQARKDFQAAVESGAAAAHVELNARDSNRFTVSVNVPPRDKVLFNLTYEQLLERRRGLYELVVNLHPTQFVPDLEVNVNVTESGRIVNLETLPLRGGNEIDGVPDSDGGLDSSVAGRQPEVNQQVSDDGREARLSFKPSVEQQKQLAMALGASKDSPLAGQFVVRYDVERPAGGELLFDDGYFVHFFAPPSLAPLPKHVVFVLDVSGSMLGRKVEQMRQAMKHILAKLNPMDYFHLVEFSTGVKVWDLEDKLQSFKYTSPQRKSWWDNPTAKNVQYERLPAASPADATHIRRAQEIVETMADWGGTNIYDALNVGLNLTKAGVPGTKDSVQPVLVFLTDGDATVGETSTGQILEVVASANVNTDTSIFALAFGDDADQDLLKKVSLRHGGFMRHIYEAADAALQLRHFYDEISSPQLANVSFQYANAEAKSLTKHSFRTLFGGGELVVAGRFLPKTDESGTPVSDKTSVLGLSVDGLIELEPKRRAVPIGPLERMWAFLTVRQLLERRDALESQDPEAEKLKERALQLALRYKFVTPLTSLVVVKPNETSSIDTEQARPDDDSTRALPMAGSRIFGGGQAGVSALRGGYSGLLSASPILPQPQMAFYESDTAYDSVDSESVRSMPETITTMRPIDDSLLSQLPWLSTIAEGTDSLRLDGTRYMLGNNATQVEQKECSLSDPVRTGNCTLLTMCPRLHSELNSVADYRKYFCSIGSMETDRYAGVCCVSTSDDQTETTESKSI